MGQTQGAIGGWQGGTGYCDILVATVSTGHVGRKQAQRLGSALQRWTGNRWAVSIVSEGGAPTVYEVEHAAELELKAKAEAHPLVQAVLAQFPKASITAIRTPEEIAQEAHIEALPEVDDEWDPFEED